MEKIFELIFSVWSTFVLTALVAILTFLMVLNIVDVAIDRLQGKTTYSVEKVIFPQVVVYGLVVALWFIHTFNI